MKFILFYLIHCLRLQRRIGQSGNAQVTWEITSQTAGVGPSPASTFNATSGSVTMPNGVETVLLPLKVSPKKFVSVEL